MVRVINKVNVNFNVIECVVGALHPFHNHTHPCGALFSVAGNLRNLLKISRIEKN